MRPIKNSTIGILKRISHADKDQILWVILSEWESRNKEVWKRDFQLYLTAGKRTIEAGQTFLGYDILTEGLKYFPDNVSLLQQQALALARLGATKRAQEILLPLYEKGNRHPDTIGILARTHKDLWKKTSNNTEKQRFLKLARDIYQEGFRNNNNDEYNGINAATLSLFLGEHEKARDIASQVIKICKRKRPKDTSNKYWLLATLAEACLILGDEKAVDYYKEAFRIGEGMHANQSTTIQQGRLILKYIESCKISYNISLDKLDKILESGNIVFCVGHMIDHPDRKHIRFPSSIETEVRRRIRNALKELNAKIGYCSLACGTDILFAEEMLSRKAELHIHLPFKREDFIKTSVQFAGDGWVKRFNKILKEASLVIEPVSEAYLNDDCLFGFGNGVTIGKTFLHADALGITPNLLVVWDGKAGDGRFGTSDVVKFWKSYYDRNLKIINITELHQTGSHLTAGRKSKASPGSKGMKRYKPKTRSDNLPREIRPMLFADVVGFSRLFEEQMPYFMYKFMGAIGDMVKSGKFKPIFRNTWGDGLYFVFKNVSDAAYFALDLRDLVLHTDWKERGLPCETSIRIALHSGPVYHGYDPVTMRLNYYGSHVSHTALIEPVTLPGSVYVSEPFAALLKAEGVTDPICDYIGKMPLAKDYGVYPVYHLRRVSEIE